MPVTGEHRLQPIMPWCEHIKRDIGVTPLIRLVESATAQARQQGNGFQLGAANSRLMREAVPAVGGQRLQLPLFPGERHADPAYQFTSPDGRPGGWFNTKTVLGGGVEVPAGTEIRDSFVCAGTV